MIHVFHIPLTSYIIMMFIVAMSGFDPFTTWIIVMQVYVITMLIYKLKGVIYGGSQNKTN
jgi:hypothetical protein